MPAQPGFPIPARRGRTHPGFGEILKGEGMKKATLFLKVMTVLAIGALFAGVASAGKLQQIGRAHV